MSMPTIHTDIIIESVKYDGSLNRRWEKNTVLDVNHHQIIGFNYRTNVIGNSGAKTQTIHPALFYFDKRNWFNMIYIMNGMENYYYCNICSPFRYEHEKIQYTDYDIDVLVNNDFTFKVKDMDEYRENMVKYDYPASIRKQVEQAVKEMTDRIERRDIPFRTSFIRKWQKVIHNRYNL